MNILIMHAHWNNRGDEAALRALIDELVLKYPSAHIHIILLTENVDKDWYGNKNVTFEGNFYPRTRDYYAEGLLALLSCGRIVFSERGKKFRNLVKNADIVLHGPGGPSIGDIYIKAETFYLYRLLFVNRMKVPYAFYAPSMGPFDTNKHWFRNIIRRKILNGAGIFCLREPQSKQYVEALGNVQTPTVTLDSAFQHPVDSDKYETMLNDYPELKNFLDSHNKVIGVTITHLMWNPKYKGNDEIRNRIGDTFKKFISYLNEQGYGVLFIPQLFGRANDSKYMSEFALPNCLVMSDGYDCYFQQHIISKMYALVGMRYHSNIFSAKMGKPFISVAYEQKMSGFMDKAELNDYCIKLDDLSFENLREKFELLNNTYSDYENKLSIKKDEFRTMAYKTTELICKYLDSVN